MSDLDLPLAVRMMQDGYLMEIQDLKEKNEKLRELLREILNNCCEGIESTCDMCGCYRKSDGACVADVMAIELGVDV